MRIHGNPKGVFDPKGLGEGVFGVFFQYNLQEKVIFNTRYHYISFSIISYHSVSPRYHIISLVSRETGMVSPL